MKQLRVYGVNNGESFVVSNMCSSGVSMLDEDEHNTIMQILRLRSSEDTTLYWGVGRWGVNTWGNK